MSSIQKYCSVAVSMSLLMGGVVYGLQQPVRSIKRSPVAAGAPKSVDFNRDVRPILSEHCYKCHGPDAKEVKGDLRLSSAEDSYKLRDGYHVIDRKKPSESELLYRVVAKDDTRMPPLDSGMSALTPKQIQVLRSWIEQGAVYKRHWAYLPPQKVQPPKVSNIAWVKNFVDSFVLKSLQEKGLTPEPEADNWTLLRRASLTLTGLLPTEPERSEYTADLRSADPAVRKSAYNRAVDRILASQRYGEHQARYWLDAVRYADTHGMHFDNERTVYPYRDWVVNAMTQDLPFNQFTEWQIAGDLMPNPTEEMKVATGYIRMNPTTNEGGVIEEEFLVKNTFDRVDTTATVFLGVTAACAKCHDHKYDPISTKDYYSLYAFFNSTKDAPLDGNLKAPEPAIPVPTTEEKQQLKFLQSEIDKIRKSVSAQTVEAWSDQVEKPFLTFSPWQVSKSIEAKSFDLAFDQQSEPLEWKALALVMNRPIAVVGLPNAYAYVRTTVTSPKEQTVPFRFGSDDGIQVWLNGKMIHSNKVLRGASVASDVVQAQLLAGSNQLLIKITNNGGEDGLNFAYGSDAQRALEMAKSDSDRVEAYLAYGPETANNKNFRKNIARVAEINSRIPRSLVAEELPMARPAYVLNRGEYFLRAEKVSRGIPAALGKLPSGVPLNRLGLAKWLTSRQNPLVSRVIVNRIWQQHFGTGLVKSSEDFGAQGDWPSHPELLDTLAVHFVEQGWSLKKLHRLILTSATFRQRSTVTKKKLQLDPENRLISRGPRFRLDAEVLRDQVLQVSGLLQNRQGGRGFRPYQPPGLWEDVAYPDSDTAKYVADRDPSIYRRTLYLFWKRTSPHPVMSTFDAPSREACVVRRPRTNTPLQALVTMNEPAFVESARVFAESVVKSEPNSSKRLELMFRRALGRAPQPQELKILGASLNEYRQIYQKDIRKAVSLANVGLAESNSQLNQVEVAAFTMMASTFFNLDEFMTQH